MLEASLISAFSDRPGLRNKASGGEGPGGEAGTQTGRGSFVYVVTGNAAAGVLLGFRRKPKVKKEDEAARSGSASAMLDPSLGQ